MWWRRGDRGEGRRKEGGRGGEEGGGEKRSVGRGGEPVKSRKVAHAERVTIL